VKVSVTFNEQGMRLDLAPENDVEQKMVGAVLNAPGMDRQSEVVSDLVRAEISYDGHWTNQRINRVRVYLHRDEAPNAE
jgi:hypothetical protein